MKRYLKPFLIVISSLLLLAPLLTIGNPISSSEIINSDVPLTSSSGDTFEIEIQSYGDFVAESDSGDGSPSDPFIIENRYLNLSAQNKGAIQIFNTWYHFIIRNCVFIGPGLYRGIEIWGAQNGTIINNSISGFRYGIEITGISWQNAFNINVTNNTLYSNQYDNLAIKGSLSQAQFIRVVNNTIDGSISQFGCYVEDAYNCIFINNTFSNNMGSGLWIRDSQIQEILNNTAIDNGDYGFLIEDTYHINFTNNFAVGNHLDGVRCSDVINMRFHKNIIINNSEHGCQLSNASYSSLTNNTIIGNGEHGLLVTYYSSDNNIKFNTFQGNGWDCIFESSSCENNVIENNICDDVGDGGIPGFQWFVSALGISITISMIGRLLRRKKLY